MKNFIALPVGQGDAFYLKHNDFSVLIDGGKSVKKLPELFKENTKTNEVGVLVCTHNDADHANGILGFLDSPDLKCNEIWLPGRWLPVLPDVLRPFKEFYDIFVNDINSIKNESNIEQNIFEKYADEISIEISKDTIESAESMSIPENGWPERYIDNLKKDESWDYSFHNFFKTPEHRFFWLAIDAAERIQKIALSAFRRGIPVRWFQYDTNNPFNTSTQLISINARQISKTTVRNKKFSLLRLLALTISNKESLVFWSPQTTDGHPGILFTADSDLKYAKLPKVDEFHSAIVTAPHHGSEANANAYAEVKKAAKTHYPSITWIRSDGDFQRPGKSYLDQNITKRFCTLCRSSKTPKTVFLSSSKSGWNPLNGTASCSC